MRGKKARELRFMAVFEPDQPRVYKNVVTKKVKFIAIDGSEPIMDRVTTYLDYSDNETKTRADYKRYKKEYSYEL